MYVSLHLNFVAHLLLNLTTLSPRCSHMLDFYAEYFRQYFRQYFRRPYGDTHLSYKPEKAEARQNKSSLKSEARRQVKMKSDSLRVRRSRICILRRKSSGVKLEEQPWL